MRHTYECVVRWGDMDALGHVNNVVFADYLQEARVDLLRAHGAGVAMHALSEATLVYAQNLQYVAPLVFDTLPVSIDVWVAEIKAASFTLAYEIYRDGAAGRTTYVTAHTVLVPFSFAEERPRRVNLEERTQLTAYLEETALPVTVFGEVATDRGIRYPVSVRFSDLDVYGHANNVIYLEYFQESRIALLTQVAEHAERAGGADGYPPMVVAAQHVDYRQPMVLRPEPYLSRTWIARVGATSMTLEAQISDTDGTVLARGQFVVVLIDPATRSSMPPAPEYRAALEAQLG